jgi:hypothetical protein
VQVAQIMKRALLLLVPIGTVPTMRTCVSLGVSIAANDLWLWQILDTRDAFRGI